MPYSKYPKPEDYFESCQDIKPFDHWAEQQKDYLKEILGIELYEWVTKKAESTHL